ncbi:hypothetical protein ASE07_25495 [Noviherbaspirillum sp. Root189]|nr:hypothetical protein ASE07_25495 [Noviherbaspirillum sp. Root189]
MIRDSFMDAKMTEPAIRQIQMRLFTHPALRTNSVAIADDEHADDQFWIDRRTSYLAIEVC